MTLRNQVIDPSFESDDPTVAWSGKGLQETPSTEWSTSGTQSGHLIVTISEAGYFELSAHQEFDCAAGDIFSWCCDFNMLRVDASLGIAAAYRAAVYFYDADAAQIGQPLFPTVDPPDIGPLHVRMEGVEAPATAVKVRLWLLPLVGGASAGGTAECLIDSVAFYRSPILPSRDFNDGDSPGWQWDGTPNASTSSAIRSPSIRLPAAHRLGTLSTGLELGNLEVV